MQEQYKYRVNTITLIDEYSIIEFLKEKSRCQEMEVIGINTFDLFKVS
jgi:hypothetical protein